MPNQRHNFRKAISGHNTNSSNPRTRLQPTNPTAVTSPRLPAPPAVSPIQYPTGRPAQVQVKQTQGNSQFKLISALLQPLTDHPLSSKPVTSVSIEADPLFLPTTPQQSLQSVQYQHIPTSTEPGQALQRHLAGLRLIQQQLWRAQQQLQYHATEISSIQLQFQQQYLFSYSNFWQQSQ